MAQKVGRRELYSPVPPPLLYATIFFSFSLLTQELLNCILEFNFVKRGQNNMGAKAKEGLHSGKKLRIFTVILKFLAKIVEDLFIFILSSF